MARGILARRLGTYPVRERPVKVAFAQQDNLIYSDDYLDGWPWGFRGIGADIRTWSIANLVRAIGSPSSPYSTKGWAAASRTIAKEMAQWGADLVFVHHGRYGTPLLGALKELGIRTAVYLCDEPYESGESWKYGVQYDYVFTMDLETVDFHQRCRANTERRVFYLPPAINVDRFKPGLFERWSGDDGFFLGNASLAPRPSYLHPIENEAKICFWKPTGKGQSEWIPLANYPRLYGTAKIGLNIHRLPWIDERQYKRAVLAKRSTKGPPFAMPSAPPPEWGTGFWNTWNLPASHINPRFFEFAAMGTFQLCDGRGEIKRLFPDAVVVLSPEEFVDRFHYHLAHKTESLEIADACCDLTLRLHTWKHRCAEVLLRTGCWESIPDIACSSLGEPKDWLSTLDYPPCAAPPLSAQTGPSNFSTPPTSRSSIRRFGNISRRISHGVRRLS
jgi:spore maturation protein CgeB